MKKIVILNLFQLTCLFTYAQEFGEWHFVYGEPTGGKVEISFKVRGCKGTPYSFYRINNTINTEYNDLLTFKFHYTNCDGSTGVETVRLDLKDNRGLIEDRGAWFLGSQVTLTSTEVKFISNRPKTTNSTQNTNSSVQNLNNSDQSNHQHEQGQRQKETEQSRNQQEETRRQAEIELLRNEQIERINQANVTTGEAWQNLMGGLGDITDMIIQNMFRNSINRNNAARQSKFSELQESVRTKHGTLSSCVFCNGKGFESCASCHSSGKKTCVGCLGKGTSNCTLCSGTGSIAGNTCASCGGKGLFQCTICNGTGISYCTACNGTGENFCVNCQGTGQNFIDEISIGPLSARNDNKASAKTVETGDSNKSFQNAVTYLLEEYGRSATIYEGEHRTLEINKCQLIVNIIAKWDYPASKNGKKRETGIDSVTISLNLGHVYFYDGRVKNKGNAIGFKVFRKANKERLFKDISSINSRTSSGGHRYYWYRAGLGSNNQYDNVKYDDDKILNLTWGYIYYHPTDSEQINESLKTLIEQCALK